MSITEQEYLNVTSKVLGESKGLTGDPCAGCDFEKKVDLDSLLRSMKATGFQALNLGDEKEQSKNLFGASSNMVSCGLREVIRFLVKYKYIDAMVVTAGGIEEDFIKVMHPTLLGDFYNRGTDLYPNGFNRIGNLIIPNSNYCEFENWMTPVLTACLEEQNTKGTHWTPSKLIHRLGLEINSEDSIYYWAAKNNIPVYSPAVTDGFVLDDVADCIEIEQMAFEADKVGVFLSGAGIAKHHILNSMKRRGGCDYCAMISTSSESDASDGGSEIEADKTKGFFSADCKPARVNGDASIILPLIVSQTFAKSE
ncbi:Deoxyhypusine synthase [Entamoeba marina]